MCLIKKKRPDEPTQKDKANTQLHSEIEAEAVAQRCS